MKGHIVLYLNQYQKEYIFHEKYGYCIKPPR